MNDTEIPSLESRIQSALQSYQLGYYQSLKAAATALEVPVSTLKHRAAGRKSKLQEAQKRLAMDPEEEKALTDWIFQLHRLGVPARPSRLREMADHIRRARDAKQPPLGPNWATRFVTRHPEIKSVMSEKLDKERWDNVTRTSMEHWFSLYRKVIEEHRILDCNIYNMDEKGCILGISERARILIPSSSSVKYRKQPGDRESATVIECICNTGVVIPPFIIWSAKTHRNNWIPLAMNPSMDESVFATSPNGYTDHELGFEWVSKVFQPATLGACRGHTRLLLMDGHSSHLTGKFLGFCHDNNILPLCLPPHTTHMLQPLDVGCFSPLAHYYRAEVDEASQYGLHGVTKYDFVRFYSVARERAFTAANINSAFRKTGLVPLNPLVILDKLIPQDQITKSPTEPINSRLPEHSDIFQTPRDYTQLLDYCQILEAYIQKHGNDGSPSRRLPTKVRNAIMRKSAEFAILQRDNAGLTKVLAAKVERKNIKGTVLSTGRVLTLVEVHKIREQEQEREREKEQKSELKEKRKIQEEDPASGPNKKLKAYQNKELAAQKTDSVCAALAGEEEGQNDLYYYYHQRKPPTCSGCRQQGHKMTSCPLKKNIKM